jgi:hypothetical protein
VDFLVDKKLLEYLPVAAPFAELPPPFDRGFQPRPEFTMKKIIGMKNSEVLRVINDKKLIELKEFSDNTLKITRLIDAEIKKMDGGDLVDLADELNNALKVTALRAKFKYLLLTASAYKSLGDIKKYNAKILKASSVYQIAIKLVREQKKYYRYDKYISDRFDSFTSYDFGYLYPVSELFFWKREMEQLKTGQFNAFFMKIWDFEKILGLSSLF